MAATVAGDWHPLNGRPQEAERRSAPRRPCLLHAVIVGGYGEPRMCTVFDRGPDGLGVGLQVDRTPDVPPAPAIGTPVEVILPPDGSRGEARLRATVRWVSPEESQDTIGLSLDAVDARLLSRLFQAECAAAASAEAPPAQPRPRLAPSATRGPRARTTLDRVTAVMAGAALLIGTGLLVDRVVGHQPVVTSTVGDATGELRLRDADGRLRVAAGLHDNVPVVQLFSPTGVAAITFGQRFDGAPFIDISNARGESRVLLDIDESGRGRLRLLDEAGNTTFAAR
ncbi:MAG: PilZ domain-containing protein [Ectothiorhodospiraceae bacterium]|nr:PilZ domain-containing protein [Ectothiorhodospiraceae bacterium]